MGINLRVQSVTCHMAHIYVTYHLTRVKASHLNPSQTDGYSTDLPRRDERLS